MAAIEKNPVTIAGNLLQEQNAPTLQPNEIINNYFNGKIIIK